MAKLESQLEDITRSKACRVVFNRRGSHTFGGHSDVRISGWDVPHRIHHILTLDTQDLYSPLSFVGARFVPLLYPLSYSCGGGEISYRVDGDFSISIAHLSGFSSDDPDYFGSHELPERKATLKPITYAERRILLSSVSPRSWLDESRMKRLWNGQCFRVAGMTKFDNERGTGCPKSSSGSKCTPWRFAHFPASEVPFGDIWGEYSWTVWFCFSVCFDCGTIHAYNTCD